MAILFIDKIKATDRIQFLAKLEAVSIKLQVNPNWLMVVMNSESGLNPAAYNPTGGASGLIQFMPSTAKALGTTTEELRKMSASKQLDYVYKYFKPYAGRMKGAYDVYLVTFFPAAVGKPDSYILETKSLSRSLIAKQNPAIDLNKNQEITVGEFKKWFAQRTGGQLVEAIDPTWRLWNRAKNDPEFRKKLYIFGGIGLAVAGTGTFFLVKYLKNK